MKYVFFGSPEFAKIILEKLINAGYVPLAIVCNPDKPAGRKKIITPPPVKILAQAHNIPVIQLSSLKIGNWKLEIEKIKLQNEFDFFVVASYAKLLKQNILDIPILGTIGIHPSLLPKYRGTSPIQNQILGGDETAGTTLYLMNAGIDDGPIINKSEIKILRSETYTTLHDKLADLSANLLIETLPKFLAGKIKPTEQNHNQATFTKKFITQDGFIEYADLEKAKTNCEQIAIDIDKKIRALNPEPGVFTIDSKTNKRMKILEAQLTLENKLVLKIIQYEGKNPVRV